MRRKVLLVATLVAAVFAAWTWFRPYDWGADPAARCRIVGCQVKQDHANYWVRLHLKMRSGMEHDLMKPVRLLAAGREIEPADVTMSGDKEREVRELWLSFWVEPQDLGGALRLKVNDGVLLVRARSGVPKLGSDGAQYFVTESW